MRQMSIEDFLAPDPSKVQQTELDHKPDWHRYRRNIDGREYNAYECMDKEWYVLKSLISDSYDMMFKREFEKAFTKIS